MTKVVGIKNTALTPVHTALGAKMVPFAGFQMPVSYTGINAEHEAVRKRAGIFDVSHMGEFRVRGRHALELIQRLTSNDASLLKDGKVQYSCLTNKTGGIIDDLLVYRFSAEDYMLVVNAANIEKDWNWISSQNTAGAELENISDHIALLAVQGPAALAILQTLTRIELAEISYYAFRTGRMAGISDVIISATGYTGAGGFELYIPAEQAKAAWDAILAAGVPFGLQPAGLGARDTLRLEMGYCLYGQDIDDNTSPVQAGLGWVTKFSKEFTASAQLQAEKTAGPESKLIGFEMSGRGIPRHDHLITSPAGLSIGRVTSGTQSPSLGKGIGMGYVPAAWATPGTEIAVLIRGERVTARVVKLPFYQALSAAH